ncbi:hypothetical protein KBZ14_04405 [Synechococcus sp. HJ21-Hayes]|uniref:formyltransferase family protein n=1 Tax=unclassified Synechococcus TaxID=2626047 RepID=UPI0020CC87BE|nr:MULTISPECIES: formyltransferase family protein [unclassified Synechococcus]MCP9830080.1 hypothetical protein [Synechococcus sp. JJ3a-Johnson]MCP9852112.1 hypothetical protein [Synechococcus sp. HJ21-Hayes]
MKALILTSNSLRHAYFARAVARCFDAPTTLVEEKKNYYAQQRDQSAVVCAHFESIAAAEKLWFADAVDAPCPDMRQVGDINAPDLVTWAGWQGFDVLCLFGTVILGQHWLDAFPAKIVNLHLGLSPFYRGSATLFWPFVNRELEYLGTTIHLATSKVDAGQILARIDPDLWSGETYYDITSRLIRDSIDQFPSVVSAYLEGCIRPAYQEDIAGKLYRKSDFSEAALLQALAYVGVGLSEAEVRRIEARRECRYSQ